MAEAVMFGLLCAFGVLLACGLFLVAADALRLPFIRASKAMANTGRGERTAEKTANACFLAAAGLSPYIRMDAYKRGRLKNVLKAGGLNLEPEVYQAYAIVKAGAVAISVIPAFFIFPLLSVPAAAISVMVYFKEMGRADGLLLERRGALEAELPRFVFTIEQELKNSRDVLAMVEHYEKNAGERFSGELKALAADMRSGSYEAALTRFEAGLNSPMLSDVVRGLIGVLRGDDGVMYFRMLSRDFKQMELRRLKKEAGKIPPKIRVYSFVMLLCFLLMYLVAIGTEIIDSMGAMF